MKPIVLATILASIGGQATALSCLRPDPVMTFQELAAAPERYFVLYGELTFDEALLPQTGGSFENPPQSARIDGRFTGKGLTSDGFTSTYVSDVVLEVGCGGPWCGSARSGVDAVYFVPFDDPPVTLSAQLCGGRIFEEPSQAVLDMLTSCMQGGVCQSVP